MSDPKDSPTVKYVVDSGGDRRAVLIPIDEWERILGWMDTGCCSWMSVWGLAELFAAHGDPEAAGWTDWASFRRKWLPSADPGEDRVFRCTVWIRPAVLRETERMTDEDRRRAIRMINRVAHRPRLRRGFRMNVLPVEEGWEVRWVNVKDWHIIYAFEEGLRQEVVLTIFKRPRYPGFGEPGL